MTRTVTLERRYEQPPERVFEAWTDVDLLSTWFGCGPEMLWEIHLWEPHVGGRLRVSLDFDGEPFFMDGEFLVVDQPTRLQYRWGDDQTITVDIAATATGSLLTLTHDGLPTDEQQGIVNDGWTTSLGQLHDAVTAQSGSVTAAESSHG